MKQKVFIALFLFAFAAEAQLVTVPVQRQAVFSKKKTGARTQSITPLSLPFWDDFSFTTSEKPYDSLWSTGASVWVNNSMGINPPSLFVATFDGLDSLGEPYVLNDILAKGFADRMISQPIRLDLLPVDQMDSVYISFFYQVTGRGEPPDDGDIFSLHLKDSTGAWEKVFEVENNVSLQPDQFYQVVIKVNGGKFFHNDFQFRFENFARLTGPFDTWHLDYVYVNKSRFPSDDVFPDRTLASAPSSLFKNYWSIPVKHFLTQDTILRLPETLIYNLRDASNQQPLNYNSNFTVSNYDSGVLLLTKSDLLDSAQSIGSLFGLTFGNFQLTNVPDSTFFSQAADSIVIQYKLVLNTKDNVPIGLPAGDYDPLYTPIDFRHNDTLQASHILSKYYAYDDGVAEYGAGLNQPGSHLACQFDMLTASPDTIVAIDIYFPQFSDNSNQSLLLQIWSELTSNTSVSLHSQTIQVVRTSNNLFTRYILTEPVGVQTKFFAGWRQSAANIIPAGLDKNNNSSTKMFFNTNAVWEQNFNVTGSLMIRPVFGKGNSVITGARDQTSKPVVFPNPSEGTFFITGQVIDLKVRDGFGRLVEFTSEMQGNAHRISLNTSSGIFILHWHDGRHQHARKVMVREQ